ncbi:MAG: hypothetical protein JFR38_02805 [Muribaculaceae bacterium]|nr:hypothetical protein [Muribaculaceae bacterium]
MSYDSFLSILGVVLIPVAVWWMWQPASRTTRVLGLVLIAFFGQGSAELAGFNATILRYLFELPLAAWYLSQVLRGGIKHTPGGKWMLAFMIASVPATFYTSGMMYVLFVLQYMNIFMAFYCFYHARIPERERQLLVRLTVWLCVSQFFAAVLKFGIVGIMEPYIGSMSSHAGGITTLFSLAGFTACLLVWFCSRRKSMLWMCVGFIIFGLVGEKRALVFMIPVSYFICFLMYSRLSRVPSLRILRNLTVGIILAPVLFYVMVRVHPSFNRERKVWGEFDLEYTLNYADKYNSGAMAGDDKIGRAEALGHFQKHLSQAPTLNLLFGYGTGLLVQSGYNKDIGRGKGGVEKYALRRWGIGYAMSIGFLSMIAQVGVIGLAMYLMIWMSWLIALYRMLRRSGRNTGSRAVQMCYVALACVVCCIFLSAIYNNAALILNPASCAIMFLLAEAMRLKQKTLKQ